MEILVIENEAGVAQFIEQGLRESGYAVDVARDGIEGRDYALAIRYDAIVLDIMLPRMNGLEVLNEIRDQGVKTPVLLLTARDGINDRVRGLLRRPLLQADTVLRAADLEMDLAKREAHRADQPIELSPREFSLLELLLRHPNQALSRTQIIERVWNFDFYSDTNVVDVYIGYLRRKIDEPFDPPLIQTVRGVGYKLVR